MRGRIRKFFKPGGTDFLFVFIVTLLISMGMLTAFVAGIITP